MKNTIYYVLIILYLTVVCSCSNDLLLEHDQSQASQLLSLKEKDSFKTRSYCYRCLPMVSVTHDPYNQFVLSWTGYTVDPMSHPVTISYKINKSSSSKRIGYRDGEIRENIYNDSYVVAWSISCGASACSSCKKSGSFSKLSTGETIEGLYSDCNKEYLNYRLVKVDNQRYTYDLVLEDPQGNRFKAEKYMTIDIVKTYIEDSYPVGREQEIMGGASLKLIAPYQLRLIIDYNTNMNRNYKIKLMSSKCTNNNEHYFEASYRMTGMDSDMGQLRLIKTHK